MFYAFYMTTSYRARTTGWDKTSPSPTMWFPTHPIHPHKLAPSEVILQKVITPFHHTIL